MSAHATGDAQATGQLRRLASYSGTDFRAAMDFFPELPPRDATAVTEVLGR